MPKQGRKKQTRAPCNDYEHSDSSDDDGNVTLERYQQAALQEGLQSKRNRVRAVRELALIVSRLYRDAPKAVQLAIFDDLLAAVKVVDSRPVYSEELNKLVRQAQKVLPQQKRNQLNKELKATQLAQKRSGRREGSSSNVGVDDSDTEEEVVVFGHLPLEVVGTIFSHLDPLTLGAATCVCRDWMQISYDCDSWRSWLEAAGQLPLQGSYAVPAATRPAPGPDAASSSQQQSVFHRAFCRLVRARRSILLPWRSDRVIVNGRLGWQGVANPMDWLRLHAIPRCKLHKAGGTAPRPIDVDEVGLWLMGHLLWLETFFDLSDASDDSSDDLSDEDAQVDDNVLRRLRLWNFKGKG